MTMSMTNSGYLAIGVFVVYTAIVGVIWRINKVRYDHLADSRSTVARGIVVPIGIGALFLAVVTTVLGWWHPVLFDEGRTGPAWALVVPLLFLTAGLVGLTQVDWRSEHRSLLPALALGTLLVGFAEETLTRGILVVGGRDQGWTAVVVFLVSTLLFAGLHALNAFFGLPWRGTLLQIVMAFLGGTAFYVTRLSTGTLIVGIVIHALWDFVTLGALATGRTAKPLTMLLAFSSYLLGVVAIIVILATS
jgi:membrane protease YdiL (CAAX protease family)